MKSIKSIKSIHIVSILTSFFVLLNIYYIFSTKTPPSWDQSLHLELSLIYNQLIKQGTFNQIIQVSNYYPPFFHVSSSMLYSIFGTSLIVSRLTNIIYLIVGTFSVYGIAKKYLFNDKVAVIASMTFLVYPLTISMSITYLSELALTSMIALTIYFLLKSEQFNDIKYSALFGLAFGCAELTKWTAVFFIIGPVVYVLYKKYKTKVCLFCGVPAEEQFCSRQCEKKYRKNVTPIYHDSFKRNVIIALLVAFIVAGTWYIPNFEDVKNNLTQGQQYWGTMEGEPDPVSLESFVWYIKEIPKQIGLMFSFVLLISTLYLFKQKDLNMKLFFAFSIVTPYIVFTLTKNKNMRYTMPLLMFFAIITAYFLYEVHLSHKIGKLVMVCILLIGTVQAIPMYHPDNEDWMVEDIIDNIHSQSDNGVVVILPDHKYINGRTLSYYSRSKGYNLNVINAAYISPNDFSNGISNVDFVVYKEGGKIGGTYGSHVDTMYQIFNSYKDRYVVLNSYNLPDNSTILIYIIK